MSILAAIFMSQAAFSASIVGSRHDLSASTTRQLCDYCHTPDTSHRAALPVWSHGGTGLTFAVYGVRLSVESPLESAPVQRVRGGATRLCLSCHDGLSAGAVLYSDADMPDARHHPADRSSNGLVVGNRPPVRGTGLIAGHPVFVSYPIQPEQADFYVPPLADARGGAASDLKLVGGMVECVSCHNVHDPTFKPFLRRSNAGSVMCLSCHRK